MKEKSKEKIITDNDLVEKYISWLKTSITAYTFDNGVVEINSPFMDRRNDHLQIFVIKENDLLRITDDGYTINDLESSGLEINTETRRKILDVTLSGFGVNISNDNELYVLASVTDFPAKKHRLIQAMLAVNDMYVLSTNNIASLFKQDVEKYLRENHVKFSKDVTFYGKSGLAHSFDFLINPSDNAKERLIKTSSRIDSSTVSNILFSWNEIIELRGNEQELFLFISDTTKTISSKHITAFRTYGVTPILWKDRLSFLPRLA